MKVPAGMVFIRTSTYADVCKAMPGFDYGLYVDIQRGAKTLRGDSDGLQVVDVTPDIQGDRARDQRATGPSPEEERRARGLDEEQGIYRSFS